MYTEPQKFPIRYGLFRYVMRGNISKCILMFLYCTEYNEINMRDSGVLKYTSREKWYEFSVCRVMQKISATL